MENRIYEISVTDLRPGLTVYKEIERHGKTVIVPDVYLLDYHTGGYPPREFIYGHRLEFVTGTRSIVVWRNAGRVLVSNGRAIR
jgi:hypothetical protein